MQTFTGIAHQLSQSGFNVEMDVFEFELPFKFAGLDFFNNLLHAAFDIGQVLIVQNTALIHHRGVGDRAGDVGQSHTLVKIDACRVTENKIGNGFGKATRPGFFLLS